MSERAGFRQNFLLAALPTADYKRFTAGLKPVRLSLGATVYKADVPLAYAYFPTTSHRVHGLGDAERRHRGNRHHRQ